MELLKKRLQVIEVQGKCLNSLKSAMIEKDEGMLKKALSKLDELKVVYGQFCVKEEFQCRNLLVQIKTEDSIIHQGDYDEVSSVGSSFSLVENESEKNIKPNDTIDN